MSKKVYFLAGALAIVVLIFYWWLHQLPSTEISDHVSKRQSVESPAERPTLDKGSQSESSVIDQAPTAAPEDLATTHSTNDKSPIADAVDSSKSPNDQQSAADSKPEPTTSVRPEKGSAAKTAPAFPGIKQEVGDVMISNLKHTPGHAEDSFVVEFRRVKGRGNFHGNAWLIGDYVQRGTTEPMSMASHADLGLAADGTPRNPKVGIRVTIDSEMGLPVSKKFTIKRPGFEGEELSSVRVGLFDRSSGKLHIAKVSASRLVNKLRRQRAKIVSP